MDKQSGKLSDREIDEFGRQFSKRYIVKKRVNAILCFVIALCGTSAVLYSRFIFNNPLIDRLRYMTFWGTIFSSVISLISGIVCLMEATKETEVTYRHVYFLRLSSATAELVIFSVVMFGLTPLEQERKYVSSYPGIMMHLVIPIAAVFSFLFNDAPLGKPGVEEPLKGTLLLAVYAVVMITVFRSGILPDEKAPYSFFDFENTSLLYRAACFAGIFGVGYLVSWLLMRLNMKLSWIWFFDIDRLKKKG